MLIAQSSCDKMQLKEIKINENTNQDDDNNNNNNNNSEYFFQSCFYLCVQVKFLPHLKKK